MQKSRERVQVCVYCNQIIVVLSFLKKNVIIILFKGSQIRRLGVVKMLTLPKAICKFNATPSKIPKNTFQKKKSKICMGQQKKK